MCEHRLNGGPLVCQRAEDHDDSHVYISREADDRHALTESSDA